MSVIGKQNKRNKKQESEPNIRAPTRTVVHAMRRGRRKLDITGTADAPHDCRACIFFARLSLAELRDNRELELVKFLSRGRQPKVNISHARTVASPKFPH